MKQSQRPEQDRLTLVLGGTGKTGRRVAQRLAARGVPVHAVSRTTKLRFDWEDTSTWGPVLENMSSAYITYYPDLAFRGAADRVAEFADLAVKKGVRRLVLFSGRNEDGALRGEQGVRDSGAEWTLVRSSFLNQNFSESFFLEPIQNGELAFPAGDVLEPFIDAEDIADVAVAALTDDRHVGQLYEVTGPRLLSFSEAVGVIAREIGRAIRYVPISGAKFAASLSEAGLPAHDVSEYTDLFTTILDGRSAYVADGVQRALGRAPRDFRDFARAAAATGVWSGRGPQTAAPEQASRGFASGTVPN